MIKKVVSDSKATNSPNEIVSDITNLLPIQIIINAVSYTHLDIQKILVSPEEKERLNHLQAGEFGLLLPEKLKGQEEELKKRYEDYLTPSDEQGKSQLPRCV